MNIQNLLNQVTNRAMRLILADIKKGDLPVEVSSFSELHDYVDANMYTNTADTKENIIGEYGKHQGWEINEYLIFDDVVKELLNQWLKVGRLSKEIMMKRSMNKIKHLAIAIKKSTDNAALASLSFQSLITAIK